MRLNFLVVFLLVTSFFNSYAQTFKSTNSALLIKDVSCQANSLSLLYLRGILVNRSSVKSEGILNLKIHDKDNDVVYQTSERYHVGEETGVNFNFLVDIGKCESPYKYLITITECKLAAGTRISCLQNQ